MTKTRNWTALTTANAQSRRQMITRTLFGVSSVATLRAEGHETSSESAGTKTIITVKAIHEELDFQASPRRIYEALLDSKKFTAFSGGRAAEIHREVGGSFSIFAGHIVGRNLELIPGRRIVQAWRVVPLPEGVYSIARFEFGAPDKAFDEHWGIQIAAIRNCVGCCSRHHPDSGPLAVSCASK